MAPDSNKVMPVFGSWIAAHDGEQRYAAMKKQEIAGNARELRSKIAGWLLTYTGKTPVRIDAFERLLLEIFEHDPAGFVR